MGIPFGVAFKAAQLAVSAEMLGLDLDYTSVLKWGYRLAKAGNAIARHSAAVDERALAEMVSLAQSRAAHRTGRLRAGIAGERDGDVMVFRAEARRDESSADYAPFVERGTRAGTRGRVVADATFNELANGRRRRARRSHPGTAAQPFFYSSAQEVLERRRIAQEQVLARASATDLVET